MLRRHVWQSARRFAGPNLKQTSASCKKDLGSSEITVVHSSLNLAQTQRLCEDQAEINLQLIASTARECGNCPLSACASSATSTEEIP